MQKKFKNKLLITLCSALLFSAACLSMALATTNYKYAAASGIDYVRQDYVDINTDGYRAYENYIEENIVYKIHCPDVSDVAKETYYEISGSGFDGREYYSTQVNFYGYYGCIIFEKGVPGLLNENINPNKPFVSTEEFKEFYDILHYDELNETVYIRYKNLDYLKSQLYAGQYGDPGIFQRITEHVNIPQKIELATIYSSAVENSFYFSSGAAQYSEDLSKMYFRLNYNPKTISSGSIEKITFSFDADDGLMDGCEIADKVFSISDFVAINDTTEFVDIEVSTDSFTKGISLKALVEFNLNGDKFTYEYKSIERTILQLWVSMKDAEHLEDNYGSETALNIERYIAAYESGLNSKAKTSTFLKLAGVYDEQMQWYKNKIIDSSYIYSFQTEESFNFILRISSSEYTGDIPFEFDINTLKLTPTINLSNSIIQIIEKCLFWYDNYSLYFICNDFQGVDVAEIMTDDNIVSAALSPAETEYINELLAQIEEWKSKYESEAVKTTELDKELALYKTEVEELQAEIIKFNAIILANKNSIENLTATKANLETQLAQKETEIQTLQSSLSATTSNYNTAAAELETKKIEYNELKANYDAVCAAQDGDIKAMIKTINDYRSKIAENELKLNELEQTISKLEEENEKLTSQKGTISMGCNGSVGSTGTIAASIMAIVLCTTVILARRAYARKKK